MKRPKKPAGKQWNILIDQHTSAKITAFIRSKGLLKSAFFRLAVLEKISREEAA